MVDDEDRTRTTAWFAVVIFAYYYKAVLCGFVGHTLGFEAICETWIRGISTNHWIEIVVYCPLLWLALHQLNRDVFASVPASPASRRRHERRRLISDAAIAIVLYGTGVHIANVIEINARERSAVSDGELYDLVYFLDEGLSHYLQFVPLFFVLGWFVLHDRPGRIGQPVLAVFFGVAHGVERTVGIIEGGKWFLGPPTVVWLGAVAWVRYRRVGPAATQELFFRYAVAFCLTLPLGLAAYHAWVGSFAQPSGLADARVAQIAAGAAALTVATTAVLVVADRRWARRRGVGLAG